MELEAILGIDQLRYLAQDETRIGRKTETRASDYKHWVQAESESTVASRSVLGVWRGRTARRLAVDEGVQQTEQRELSGISQ